MKFYSEVNFHKIICDGGGLSIGLIRVGLYLSLLSNFTIEEKSMNEIDFKKYVDKVDGVSYQSFIRFYVKYLWYIKR